MIALCAAAAMCAGGVARAQDSEGVAPFTGYNLLYPACSATTQVQAAEGKNAAAGKSKKRSAAAEAATVSNDSSVMNKTVVGGAALQNSSRAGTYDALATVPGMQNTQSKEGSGADSLAIRGIKLDNSSNYRLDGALVLNNQINMPVEDKCHIEALKGAGALQYGIASPAGIVNYVMKRATNVPVAAVGFASNSFGTGIASLDVGRKFGKNNQFGFRLNLAGGNMGAPAAGAGGTRYVGGLTGDWYISDRAAFQFDVEQVGINVVEQSSLLLNKAVKNQIALPDVKQINPGNLLSGPWAWSLGWERNFAGRFAYGLSPNTTLILQSGQSTSDRPYRIVSQIGTYNIKTGLGTSNVTLVSNQKYVNTFYNAEIKSRIVRDNFANEVTLGFDVNDRSFTNPQNPKISYKQNLYNPFYLPPPPASASAAPLTYLPDKSHDTDPYFSDTVSLFNRLRIIGGLRQITYTANDAKANGTVAIDKTSTLAPAAGVIFDLRPNVSAYASFVESLQETGQAPASAANAFEVLPPAKAQQKEVGIRASDLGSLTSSTLAYFRINEANATADPVTNIFALNGTITYEGLETTQSLRLSKRFTLRAGGILMRGIQHSDDPTVNNRAPENTPNINYNLGFTYALPFAPGFSINADRQYTGWFEVNPQDQALIPGVSVGSLGARFTKTIEGHRFSVGANVSNLLDKRYFRSAVSNNLGIGPPRTFTLTSSIDL